MKGILRGDYLLGNPDLGLQVGRWAEPWVSAVVGGWSV